MSTSGATNPNFPDGKISVAKPDLFYGERNKVDDWLMQLQVYFQFQPETKLPKEKWPLFATTYMRGNAYRWIKPYVNKHLSGNGDHDGTTEWMMKWTQFKDKIKRILGLSNEDKVAIRMIQHIKQRRSAAEYTTQFKQYSVLTDWDDDALMVMYRRGLKENVKDEITFDGRAVDTLDELIAQAIDIDDKLFERAMEKRHDGGYSHPAWHVSNHYKPPNKAPPHDLYGYAPMELDAVHHKGRFTKGRNNKKGKALKCYACGKLGHMAKDCRSKNKVH